jgi:deoxyribonuclease V
MRCNSRFNIKEAIQIQNSLSKKIIKTDCLPDPIIYIAGIDVAYANMCSFGAVVVLNFDSMKILETKYSFEKTKIPYIPTFLSFRELPPTISAFNRLKIKPDIILVDGHGYAHPRHLGFASHLGLVLNTPTIGISKNILCGKIVENKRKCEKIVHDLVYKDKIIGKSFSVNPHVKPIYISLGHMISLKTALKIVLLCLRKFRIPEPIRLAHILSNQRKNRYLENNICVSKIQN